jgi:hypothetical protein
MEEKMCMNNILFEVWLKDRLVFSESEKRECFKTAYRIVNLAQYVRQSGLLSIDEKIPAISDKFLQRAMRLAVDSTEPELIEKIMQTWTVYGNYSGAELLKRIIIIEGAVAIVNGENPLQIHDKLAAYFGEDLLEEYSASRSNYKPLHIKSFLNEIKDKPAPGGSLEELEAIIKSLDNMSVQVLIRCIENADLLLVLKGSSGQVIEKILANVSSGIAQELADEYLYLKTVRTSDITASQNRVLEKIKELEQKSEMVIAKNNSNGS